MVYRPGAQVDDLPLGLLAVLLSHKLCPTRLPSEAPQLLAVLRRLFCGPSPPLTGVFVSAHVAQTLQTAREARDAERLRCYRTVLPLQLLERVVFEEQDGDVLAWPPLVKLLATWRAQDNLEWMLGDVGCGQHVWDMVAGKSASAVRPSHNIREDGPDDSEWRSPYSLLGALSPASSDEHQDGRTDEEGQSSLEASWIEASDRVSCAAASLLADMCELWNESFPDLEDPLHVESSAALLDALLSTATETQSCRMRADAARVRALLCRRACVFAREEAVRRAMRAVDGPGRTLREADAARAEQLLARGRATAAKVRLVRARAARDAYCADGAVPALCNALAIVHTRRREVAAEVREKEQRLSEYEALGSGFRELVAEYARLRKVLEQTLWTRNELQAGMHE
jgi:hypothetical protein